MNMSSCSVWPSILYVDLQGEGDQSEEADKASGSKEKKGGAGVLVSKQQK